MDDMGITRGEAAWMLIGLVSTFVVIVCGAILVVLRIRDWWRGRK